MGQFRMIKINSVILSGRIANDIKIQYTPDGTAVLRFRIAYSQKYYVKETWKEHTSFIPAIIWGEQAEKMALDIGKGDPIILQGNIESREWKDRNQNRKSIVQILVQKIQLMEKRDKPADTSEENESNEPIDDLPF